MKIRRIRVQKDDLLRLTTADRDFLLLAGHMLNEINSMHKVFTWCMTGHRDHLPANLLEGTLSNAQSLIYARLLAGKLLEGWEAMGRYWYGTKISARLEPLLHADAQASLAQVKRYFSAANLIYRVRQSFAFHYSASRLGESWERASEKPFCELVLGGTIGNNFFVAAELAANVAVFRSAQEADEYAGMARFLDEVGRMSITFTTFLEGVVILLMEEALGRTLWDASIEDEVNPNRKWSDVNIPHFFVPEPLSDAVPTGAVEPAPQHGT